MPSIQGFSTLRARSYIFRLPLFTRVIIVIIFAFWIVGVQSVWNLRQWGALIPSEVNLATGNSASPSHDILTSDETNYCN